MTNQKYILEGKKIVPVDLMTWARWFEGNERILRQTEVIKGLKLGSKALGTPIKVSTIFLGIDHNWGEGPPLLFETMVFGGEHDEYQERYATYDEAIEGHERAIKLVKGEK